MTSSSESSAAQSRLGRSSGMGHPHVHLNPTKYYYTV